MKSINIIYISGGGHSGSTLLGLLIGSAKDVFNAGEVKFIDKLKTVDDKNIEAMGDLCSCGAPANECTFWKSVEMEIEGKKVFYQPLSFRKLVARYFNAKKAKKISTDDVAIFRTVLKIVKKNDPQINSLIDASKSLDRLMYLYQCKELYIKNIFIIKDGRSFINSYHKIYKKGYFRWFFLWVLVNYSTLRFFKKNKIQYYGLSYESLCKETTQKINELNQFLKINIPINYIEEVRSKETHIRAGNWMKNKIKSFDGIHYDEKWRTEMPAFYRILFSIICFPFHKKWL